MAHSVCLEIHIQAKIYQILLARSIPNVINTVFAPACCSRQLSPDGPIFLCLVCSTQDTTLLCKFFVSPELSHCLFSLWGYVAPPRITAFHFGVQFASISELD